MSASKSSRFQAGVCVAACAAVAILVCATLVFASSHGHESVKEKPGPNEALLMLQEGNARFVAGESKHGHTDAERLALASRADQSDYAYATVIGCSDSRVPIERIFDAGVMELFVIRVAGNVVQTDEAGSIELGLAHMKTPLLVFLGNTDNVGVKIVAKSMTGQDVPLERNIPDMLTPIAPAVQRALSQGHADFDDLVAKAVVANVKQGIHDLFMMSPISRNLVKEGRVKVVGAVYNVADGSVEWMTEDVSLGILAAVEKDPGRAALPMAVHEPVVDPDQSYRGIVVDRGEAPGSVKAEAGDTLSFAFALIGFAFVLYAVFLAMDMVGSGRGKY